MKRERWYLLTAGHVPLCKFAGYFADVDDIPANHMPEEWEGGEYYKESELHEIVGHIAKAISEAKSEPRGLLMNWYTQDGCLHGNLWGDVFDEYPNGTMTHTTPVIGLAVVSAEMAPGFKVHTQNSVYVLGAPIQPGMKAKGKS